MIIAKTSNSTFVKTWRVVSFNMFPSLLGLEISHKWFDASTLQIPSNFHVFFLLLWFWGIFLQNYVHNAWHPMCFEWKGLAHIRRLKTTNVSFNNQIKPCLEIAMIQKLERSPKNSQTFIPTY
jgi:hypothetical protein